MATSNNQNLYDILQQIYQGTATTAGPYANLWGQLSPYYGQQGLSNMQQAMFGYNSGGGTDPYSQPATPYGGFFGGTSGQSSVYGSPNPYSTSTGGYGPTAAGGGDVNYGPPTPGGSQPGMMPPGISGGSPMPAGGTTGMMPPGVTGGNYVGTSGLGTGYNGGIPGLYSPPQGGLIGLGPNNTFNDPYANSPNASQQGGYHPGALDLNTTALSAYGPLATGSLLQSNPFLTNALGVQGQNLDNAYASGGPGTLLGNLNQAASGLDLTGALNPGQLRDASQSSLAEYGAGNTSHGNSAIASDLLSRYNAMQAEQSRNFGLASGVQGLNTTQQGLIGNLANQAGTTATYGVTNPIMQVLGLGGYNGMADPNSGIAGLNALISPSTTTGQDVTGFNANASSAQNIANQNQQSAFTNGLIGLGGSVISAFSDKRLKKKIKKVGESPSGIPEVEWEYRTKPGTKFHGALAQDVIKFNPYAVLEDPVSGIKAVDYSKIDVPFYEVNPYKEAA